MALAGALVPDTFPTAVAPTLEAARAAIPHGAVRFDRTDVDDPAIVECWI